ncbi:sensor domain-containing protein [Candidatus Mycobacterium methanotrophicum]|uniref:Sensor domain-containing protein n=1 Tax=Candidatus Mycobacterium methanotrophicum TaxID=2943498 RepID=A0ABY4QLC6_9MYCO|nr:sensor domain-containing protein [Candidatus Mycobacterium methanotrophicum]UQX11832.1 sensor domain-containing protein [Candidatus Mycobacterium methanotrophicum]
MAALDGLLLPPEQLNAVLLTEGLVLDDSSTTGQGGKTAADDCAAVWRVAWWPAYEGSGWVAPRLRFFEDPPDGATLRVWQDVVSFPLPVDANAFYAKQIAAWRTCNDRRLEQRYLDAPAGPEEFYDFGQADERDGMLTMSSTEEAVDTGWGCERALTVRNNVAVDIQVCGRRPTGQAQALATAIAAKVPVT